MNKHYGKIVKGITARTAHAEYMDSIETRGKTMNEVQEIALALLAAQRDVIWASEHKRAEAIAAALDTARLFLDISENGDD